MRQREMRLHVEMEFRMERITCLLKTHHRFSSMLLAPVSQREAGLVTKTLGAPCPDVPFPPQPAASPRHPPRAVCGWDAQTHCGLWSSRSGSSLGLALEGAGCPGPAQDSFRSWRDEQAVLSPWWLQEWDGAPCLGLFSFLLVLLCL